MIRSIVIERINHGGRVRRESNCSKKIAKAALQRKFRVNHGQQPTAACQIIGQPGRFCWRIRMPRADLSDHATVRRNGRKARQRDSADRIAQRRQRKLQPVETVGFALQKVSSARCLMAPQCFNMTIMEMCRALGNALAMAGDQTDDIDLAFQNPQDRKRHLGEILHLPGVDHETEGVAGAQGRAGSQERPA